MSTSTTTVPHAVYRRCTAIPPQEPQPVVSRDTPSGRQKDMYHSTASHQAYNQQTA